MINVKVVVKHEHEKVYPETLKYYKYYSCRKKNSQAGKERYVFVMVNNPLQENGKVIVLWLNAFFSADGLGYNYCSNLLEDYYDFQEIKDAELTFYV